MEDLACPRCKTTKYRNPSLKLFVNLCGHPLCESCVDLLFAKGSGNCPECGLSLRRSSFRNQLFEDPGVEKEIDIRRKILKDFNKRENDFCTLREYNDYLEEVETIIFNLANGIDLMETNKRIEQYKKDNKSQISYYKNRPNPQTAELDEILDKEKQRSDALKTELIRTEKRNKIRKLKNHEALIDDLMFSDTDAKSIIAQHKSDEIEDEQMDDKEIGVGDGYGNGSIPERVTQFTSGIGIGSLGSVGSGPFLPVPKVDVPLYCYAEQVLETNGPNPPSLSELSDDSPYLQIVRPPTRAQKAGGHMPAYFIRRYLINSFSDLFWQPPIVKSNIDPLSTFGK